MDIKSDVCQDFNPDNIANKISPNPSFTKRGIKVPLLKGGFRGI
jgi:hypothetical protein